MHIHILGICGTFMGGIALLARDLGHQVSGSDAHVYPPMSTQLKQAGIDLQEGYEANHLQPAPDLVIVGNAMRRGIPVIEYLLDQRIRYCSGPEWLKENILREKWVLAVAGTHGKTTTASLLAWILEDTGYAPGFLIGGVPVDFGTSARLGASQFFVVEADEYDTAFFDKRSKFVHYGPRTLILNNLEFDHADIFEDLSQIQRQFHHLIRTVPGSGLIIYPKADLALNQVLALGCWTPRETFGNTGDWHADSLTLDNSSFQVWLRDQSMGKITWIHNGLHNLNNALAALAAARHIGISINTAMTAIERFQGVKRRMELRGEVNNIRIYDDFAHHPTAIATTLQGLRARVGTQRILAVLEPRSNTMRLGVHNDSLLNSLALADQIYLYAPSDLGWDAAALFAEAGERVRVFMTVDEIVADLAITSRSGDEILVMSNGGFGGIHQRLLDTLATKI